MSNALGRAVQGFVLDVLIAALLVALWLASTGLGTAPLAAARASTWIPLVVCLVAMCFVIRVGAKFLWSRGQRVLGAPSLHRSSRAAAMTEFLIILPVLLMLLLGTMQVGLMFMAHAVVDYAAFQAVRRAVVEIPVDDGNDGSGCICARQRGDSKIESVRSAASCVTAAVSPEGIFDQSGFNNPDLTVDRALGSDARFIGDDMFSAGIGMAARQFGYSNWATGVTLIDAQTFEAPSTGQCGSGGDCFQYDRMGDVTVMVHFVYPLQIPVAAQLIGRPFAFGGTILSLFDSILARERNVLEASGVSTGMMTAISFIRPWRYIVIRSHATLPNEGL